MINFPSVNVQENLVFVDIATVLGTYRETRVLFLSSSIWLVFSFSRLSQIVHGSDHCELDVFRRTCNVSAI